MSIFDPVMQNPLGYGLIALALVWGAISNFHKVSPLLVGALGWFKRAPAAPETPTRKLALGNFDDLISYLEHAECHEGIEYFKAGLHHLYHQHAE